MSMAVGEYVSVSTQRDSEKALIAKEIRELDEEPEAELAELAGIYAAKGLSPTLALEVATQLTAHDALGAHAEAELGIDPHNYTNPWHAAWASMAAFTVGAILPLLAIVLPPLGWRVPVTVVAVVVALAFTGWLSARLGELRRQAGHRTSRGRRVAGDGGHLRHRCPGRHPGRLMARLLVVQHEPDAPVAWLGEWWTELGLELDVVRGDLGEPVASSWAAGHDGLVVLGGAMGACDDALAAWLAPTRALIADAVAREVPVLGVCLGHQLAAVALGGSVERNPSGRTIGPVPVRLTGAAASDPLLGGFDRLAAIHYNDDVVTVVPDGATVLASLPDGRPQAIRFGRRAWGVQFHPETSPEVFGAWLRWDSPDGLTPEQEVLLGQVQAAREALRAAWQPFAARFAALVEAAAMQRRASPVTF